MEITAPPIITAVERVGRAYATARRYHDETPVQPALMIAAHTEVADALDARIALIEAEMHSDVDLGHGVQMGLVLADPVKFWALQRALAADRRDAKSARDLAEWWGKQPDPGKRRRSRTGRA